MDILLNRLQEVTNELNDINARLQKLDEYVITDFFQNNKEKIKTSKPKSNSDDLVLVSTTKEVWTKHSLKYKDKEFFYSFCGPKLSSKFLQRVNKDNVKMFNI